MKMILALDLSKSSTGFAYGFPDGKPRSGSVRFGTPQHTDADVGAKALVWLTREMPAIVGRIPDLVAIEAAWESNGGHSARTSSLMLGLQFMVQAVALLRTGAQPRLIRVAAARKVFTGKGVYSKGEAKSVVQQRCIDLGWLTPDTVQADRADALCIWAAVAAEHNPDLAFRRDRKPVPAEMRF